MARELTTDAEIDDFIGRVLGEAAHHGQAVEQVIMPLSNSVRKRLNFKKNSLKVYERKGKLARTCWVTLEGKRYAFSYNYDQGKIDLRLKSIQGDLLFQFDNHNLSEIEEQVAKL